MTRDIFIVIIVYNTLNTSRTPHVSGLANHNPLVSRSCQHSSTTPSECGMRQPISARRSHGQIPFICKAAWSGKNELKTLQEFSHGGEASGAYILSARQELRLTRKGDARRRRTWKSHLKIVSHLNVVRKYESSREQDSRKYFLSKTQVPMAAERLKTVEDRKVGLLSLNLICIFRV